MPSRYNLPHIDIAPFASSNEYTGEGGFGNPAVRERAAHGQRLQAELNAALAMADQARPTDQRLPPITGTRIEVELRRGTDPEVLNLKTEGIRSGASKITANNDRTISLYVPDAARPAITAILNDYLNGQVSEQTGRPPQSAKVEAIEAFRQLRLEGAWTDDPAALPQGAQDSIWWALWCHRDSEAEMETICERLRVQIAPSNKRLYFPEIVVVPVYTTRATVELMLFATGAIAELRRASDNPVFYTDEISGDQHEWVDDLAERIVWPGADVPAVCILDTGVNRAHALIEPALAESDLHTLDNRWGKDDRHPSGHGTGMAGLVLHGDLTAALGDTERRTLAHRLESVKLLPPNGFEANDPKSYGVLTQAAVAMPEITAPDRGRVFCMAVSNESVSGAFASSWSAAIDQAAVGQMVGDESEEDEDEERPRRLFVVSAGNTPPEIDYTRLRPQDDYPIEDPAQAWNALTIGGCTDLVEIRDRGYERWSAMTGVGTISPHSRTSATWPQGIAPIKPELVMEAGNRAVNPAMTECLSMGSLSLLTTGHDVAGQPLVSFDATSAAAGQGARMAAQIGALHTDYWPETIRAMMVHSAQWTPAMLAELEATQSKRARYEMVRRFGYGVPNLERALASATNHVALFAQYEIQPFRLERQRKFNECHYYTLPIPPPMLEALNNEPLELKVTLSYFIEPNPGLSANVDPQRYQSHGLRFDHQRPRETLVQFKNRVNASERTDGRRMAPAAVDPRWILGEDSISSGSLHCDVWRGPAIDLLDRDTLCVKPVNGWWRYRASAEVCNRKTRYALIVTLTARNTEVDVYTPIRTSIGLPVPVPIEISI